MSGVFSLAAFYIKAMVFTVWFGLFVFRESPECWASSDSYEPVVYYSNTADTT